jgi:hypothetical protein
MSKSIEVFRRGDGHTEIAVRDYPDSRAQIRVRSAGDDGRRLEALGWINFKRTQELAHIDLHIEGNSPLLIVGFAFEEGTLESETNEVLERLLVCAESIAIQLQEKLDMDHGYVDWQLPGGRQIFCVGGVGGL